MKLEPLIYVSDLNKSISFYVDLLGFKPGELYPNKKVPTYAPVYIGESKLMLCQAREGNQKFHPKGLGGTGLQLFVKVEDVDKIFADIKDKVQIVDNLEIKSWGDREFTIQDPDGYLISFYSPSG